MMKGKGSRAVMKSIAIEIDELYKDIDRSRRTIIPQWDTVVRQGEIPKQQWVIPKSVWKKKSKKAVADYLTDKTDYLVNDWRAKTNLMEKALNRLTDYRLGKRDSKYTRPYRDNDYGRVFDFVEKNINVPHHSRLNQRDYINLAVDYLIEKNKDYRKETIYPTKGYKGVILFSGGLDSVAVAMLLAKRKSKYLPIYLSHRANVGNVTKKEIIAAQKLAKKILGEELMVFKADTKGKLPEWYGKRVRITDRMPVKKKDKNKRNRTFISVLQDEGLADKEIWLGVFSTPGQHQSRAAKAGRSQDVTKEGLQKHLKSIGGKGKIKTVRDIKGVKSKADLLRKLPKGFKPDVFQSQSCLMYFKQPCGDCWSCVERVEAITQVYGQDRTPYRKNSKADKIKKKKGPKIDDIIDSAYSALSDMDLEDELPTQYDDSELIIDDEPVRIFEMQDITKKKKKAYMVHFTVTEQIPVEIAAVQIGGTNEQIEMRPASIIRDFPVYVVLNEDLGFEELRDTTKPYGKYRLTKIIMQT